MKALLLQLNITALMGSENQAKNLLALIDRGLDELDVLDKRLSNYDEMLLVSFFLHCYFDCIYVHYSLKNANISREEAIKVNVKQVRKEIIFCERCNRT